MKHILDFCIQLKPILDVFEALLTPLIAVIAVYIAYRQHRNDKLKIKLDIYDRRLKIYEELRNLFGYVLRNGKMATQELLLFKSNTMQAEFLFEDEVPRYLDEVYKKGLTLHLTGEQLDGDGLRVGAERTRVAQENSDHLTWFTEQIVVAKNKFKRYLSVADLS